MNFKEAAEKRFNNFYDTLIHLSRKIHSHPETAFEENEAASLISELLLKAGFTVEKGVGGLPTALLARRGTKGLRIAVCAEYDALPGIGHACGHNLIAAMSVGAAAAVSEMTDDLDFSIFLIGTPAEEIGNGSGKILLLEKGVFSDIHAALMVHPSPYDLVLPKMIAASSFEVRYTGKESHASALPELGINALDALTIAQVSIGLLRQHILPTARIHGIITKGGDAPNIVPAFSSARFIIRENTISELEKLRSRVYRCFEAGATASGAQLEIAGGDKPYAEMKHDLEIASLYQKNAESLGRTFPDLGELAERAAASTDMGNISQVIPSIHPFIGIASLPAVNHQPEFAAACVSPSAEKAIRDGALAMAWTILDIVLMDQIRDRLQKKK